MNTQSRNYLLPLLGCVLFHALGTWNLPLIDRDEPRFAEASREMRQRGDWIVPYFNGQYRFDKPPLTYWAQAASYRVFGENDFAARFPSTIAASLTAVALVAWGIRLRSGKSGWWAAIIFTLSLQTFMHAKAAVADMWLALFMTVAFWAGWEMFDGTGSRTSAAERARRSAPATTPVFWWCMFYLSLALAFLAKGPIGLIPVIPMIWMIVRTGRRISWLHLTLGLLLTTALIAAWAVPALIKTNGEFLRVGIGRHVVKRSIGAMEGHGAESIGLYLLLLPFYFISVFLSFLPWSYKLPSLVRRARSARDTIDTYLLLGILSVFGIFTFVATKLPHYILPAFPLLALLLARQWSSDSKKSDRAAGVFRAVAISSATIWIIVSLILPPLAAQHFPSYALYRKVRDTLRPEMEFGATGYLEPSLVWYFRSRVNGYMTPLRKKKAVAFMEKPGPRFIVIPTEMTTSLFPEVPSSWQVSSASGFNIPNGRKVDLTLMLKPD